MPTIYVTVSPFVTMHRNNATFSLAVYFSLCILPPFNLIGLKELVPCHCVAITCSTNYVSTFGEDIVMKNGATIETRRSNKT